MISLIGEIFVLFGSLFILIATVGIMRMPDYLMKLQVASKASAFGIFLMLLGGNLILQDWYFVLSSIMIFIFLLVTVPVGAHALASAEKRMRR